MTDQEKNKDKQKARSKKYGISVRDDGNVTKPSEYSDVSDAEFADPVNYSYPVDTAERTRSALKYWGKQANKDKYSKADQATIKKRIDNAAKKFKIGKYSEAILAEAISYTEICKLLSKAIYDQYGYSAYEIETFKDYVVYCKLDKYYKIKYSLDKKKKEITLVGQPEQVEKTWKKMKEAFQAKIIESKSNDHSSNVWDVVLIKAGLSNNGYLYPADLLKESLSLFEGAPAIMRTDSEHLMDANKSFANIVGGFKNVTYNDDDQQVEAEFHIIESSIADKLKNAANAGLLHTIGGLSIVAGGYSKPVKKDNKIVREVLKLTEVYSIDPVAAPAAGGKFLKMAAATDPMEEQNMDMLKKMMEALEKKAPDLYKKIDQDNIDSGLVFNLYNECMQRDKPESSPASSNASVISEGDREKILAEAKAEADKRYNDWIKEQKDNQEREKMLATKLAESKLPARFKDSISKRFSNKSFTSEDVDNIIAETRDALAESVPNGVNGFGATMELGKEEKDRYSKAMDGLFMNKDVDGIPRFKSFREAYKEVTGNYRMSDAELTRSLLADSYDFSRAESSALRKMSESLNTSSWTYILGDSITRRLLAEYRTPVYDDWRKIVSDITPIKDFRTNRRMRYGGYGDLSTVGQGSSYLNVSSPSDEEASYAVSKRGGLEDMTLENIANDDVGAIRRIPQKLGQAAARTLYKAVFNIVVNNSATTYDSVALFHASHSNLGATGLSATTLQAGRIAMMGQQSYGGTSGDELGLMPKFLLVPLELEDTAFRLVTSSTLIGATNNAGTEPNIHSTYGLTPLVIPYWTDANDWALVCEPNMCPTIEVGFYAGQEEPELFVQDNPNVGTNFNQDKITYKIRHIWGICVLDHRGMYKAVVS